MENERNMPEALNKPAAGYTDDKKGGLENQNPLKSEPDALTGDQNLNIERSLPDESLSSLQAEANRNYDKV